MNNLILLSGGMDSALCLHKYGAKLAICFDYGQTNSIEIEYAMKIAYKYRVPINIRDLPSLAKTGNVYAGRNAMMIAFAMQYYGINTVIIGCNKTDAEAFPDCRPEFIASLDRAYSEAYGVRVVAPLLDMTKKEIVEQAIAVGLPETWTCYEPNGREPCGKCYACKGLT